MQFVVYIAILLVSISSILLELDWLTRPKLETKPAVQTASTAVTPPVPRATADSPKVELTPVYPKKPDEAPAQTIATVQPAIATQPAAAQPATAATSAAISPQPVAPAASAETTGSAPAASAAANTRPASPVAAVAAAASGVTVANATPAPAPANAAPAPAPSATQPVAATAQPVAASTNNRCDIAACSAAYSSFRAADCSYQPFEGPRRTCDRPPGAQQNGAAAPREPAKIESSKIESSKTEPTARGASRPSRDGDLREVERAVRQLTDRRQADLDVDDAPAPDGRTIILRRPRW